MTTFPHPLLLNEAASFGISLLKTAFREPLFLTVVGLFWLAALPIGALFSAAFAAYDNMASLQATALRLPILRSSAATSPSVLKGRGVALREKSSQASSPSHVVRA